jgi:hypothetical protein
MSKWAVAYISFTNNELITEIVEANSFHSAIMQHTHLVDDNQRAWLLEMTNWDDEAIKQAFFDCDSMIDAVKIE